jgi:hypothetical protein
LENDVEKLNSLAAIMSTIEQSYEDFTFEFIEQHSSSYLSAIILSDLIGMNKADSTKIRKCYLALSDEVKRSEDARKVAAFLELP